MCNVSREVSHRALQPVIPRVILVAARVTLARSDASCQLLNEAQEVPDLERDRLLPELDLERLGIANHGPEVLF